jgi:hypothetical protein
MAIRAKAMAATRTVMGFVSLRPVPPRSTDAGFIVGTKLAQRPARGDRPALKEKAAKEKAPEQEPGPV